MTVETVISPEAFVDKRGHKGSERRCVATGETLSKSDMIRFVMAPDKSLVPDIAEKLPGRGVWVKATEEALKSALTSGGFKRGLKADVKADTDEVIDLTRTLLKKRVLSLLTMSLKAGRIHMGFDQVKSAAQSGPLAWRIEASDGSAGGRSKIRVLTKAMSEEFQRQHTPVIGCFGAEVLGKALGRESMVHAALPTGPLAKSMTQAAHRLSGFCPLVPDNWEDRNHESKKNSTQQHGDKG